jgi:cysteine desulfuration protein SufE
VARTAIRAPRGALPAPRGVSSFAVGAFWRYPVVMTFEEIREDLSYLEDWESRISYVIDLGRQLSPLPDSEKTDANKVRGCASQVWLVSSVDHTNTHLVFRADSDALLVKGLVALIVTLYSGKTAEEIIAIDAKDVFKSIGLAEHLTAQRSNGVASMVERIRRDARMLLTATSGQA